MCCWPYRVVVLEEPPKPPPKKKPEEKKDKEFVLVSSDFNVQPVTSGDPMVYTSTLRGPEASHGVKAAKKESKGKGDSVWANGADEPLQFVPEVPTGNTQYYCKETNGSWKLRTTNDIMNHCQPGDWRIHPESGYPYFVRKTA